MSTDLVQCVTRLQYASSGNFSTTPLQLDYGSQQPYLASPASSIQAGSQSYQTSFNLPSNGSTQTIALGALFLTLQHVAIWNFSYDGLIEFTYTYTDVAGVDKSCYGSVGPRQHILLGGNSQALTYGTSPTTTDGSIKVSTSFVLTGYTGTTGTALSGQFLATGVVA